MFNTIVVLIVLALDAWLWWRFGWQAGAAALAITVLSFFFGHVRMRMELRAEGYAVEYKPDGTGKRRWRIGRREPVVEAAIEWIPPSSRLTQDGPPYPPPIGQKDVHFI